MPRALLLVALIALIGCRETYEVVKTDVKSPDPLELLADDKLADKQPTFDKNLVDSRPVGDWQVNLSGAVIRLDLPLIRPDYNPELVRLYPSYSAAVKAAKDSGGAILPSVNSIDGKAKQFDDGLYAALELAYTNGVKGKTDGIVDLVTTLRAKLADDSPAKAYLGAALTLAGETPPDGDAKARKLWLDKFEANPMQSRPIGFYTWSDELSRCFRALRMLMWQFDRDLSVPQAIAGVMDKELKQQLDQIVGFYAGLSNPPTTLSVADIVGQQDIAALAKNKGVKAKVAFLPPTRNREAVLFERLFPQQLAPGANLMRELIRAVRSGKVDLTPSKDAGWLDHQVYALETLLLPGKGPETQKLMLSRQYKQRMLQAFQALVTKRKETHVRSSDMAVGSAAAAPMRAGQLEPRLRVEPAPSYYLRTARAYSFLANVLESALGADGMTMLRGKSAKGDRAMPLGEELTSMRRLFYGFYLLSCEDIGLRPELRDGELGKQKGPECYKAAEAWTVVHADDADLGADTRVAVPVYMDPRRKRTRSWATLGIRLVRLRASWARRPSVRPVKGKTAPASWKAKAKDGWAVAEHQLCDAASYLIAVDEFAEVETPGLAPMTRAQLRKVCDENGTKQKILEAMKQFRP